MTSTLTSAEAIAEMKLIDGPMRLSMSLALDFALLPGVAIRTMYANTGGITTSMTEKMTTNAALICRNAMSKLPMVTAMIAITTNTRIAVIQT